MSTAFPLPHAARDGGPYTATAGQTDFAEAYPIQNDHDVVVTRTRGTVATALVLGTDYTVIGANNPSGFTIRLLAGALAGDKISTEGLATLDRTTSVAVAGRVSSRQLDRELDRNRIIDQELRRDIDETQSDLAGLAEDVDELRAGLPTGVVFATRPQAEAGTDTATVMNPLRVSEAIRAQAPSFATRTAFQAATVSLAAGTVFRVRGHTTEGVGGAWYRILAAAPSPSNVRHVQSADGVWAELLGDGDGVIHLKHLGLIDNEDNTARLVTALQLGLPVIRAYGRFGITAAAITLTAALALEGDAQFYRIGTGNTNLVTIACNGNNLDVGALSFDGQNNCTAGLVVNNTHATRAVTTFKGTRTFDIRRKTGSVGNTYGIVALGNVRPTFENCEALRITREAGTNTPGSSGNIGIGTSSTGGFWPFAPRFINCLADTISCDDTGNVGGNDDCDGLLAFTGATFETGQLTSEQHTATFLNCRGRNCKGRLIKTQCGTTNIDGLEYTHDGLEACRFGLGIINPQSGVSLNLSGAIDISFRNNGASPFNGLYQGAIVDLYSATDLNRPQFMANIGPMTINSDYVGQGLSTVISCQDGAAIDDKSSIHVSGIRGLFETRWFMTLPANATGAQYISIENSIVGKIITSFFGANAEPAQSIITLQNSGHLGADVDGVRDLSSPYNLRSGNIELIGNCPGLKGRNIAVLDGSVGGQPIARQAFVAPLNGSSFCMGRDMEHAVFIDNTLVTLRPMSRRRGATFHVRITASTAGWVRTFHVDGTTITTEGSGLNPAFFAFGNGSDPGTAGAFNIWFDGATGEMKVFNRTGSNRVALVTCEG